MFWKIIERATNLLMIVASLLMITILFNNTKAEDINDAVSHSIANVKQDALKAISNNVEYFEGRINRLAENQDTYQLSTTSRMSVLEQKVLKLEQEDKKSNRVVNVNNNNNTQNNNPAVSQ